MNGGVQVPTRSGGVGVPPMPEALTGMNQGSAGAMFAALLQKRIGNRRWDWFGGYQAEWLPLAIGAPMTARNIQVDSDSDFLAIATVGIARAVASPAAMNADRPFLISMRQSGTGFVLFDSTDFNMMVGTAVQPAWWGLPRLMPLGSTFVVSLQNLDAATAWNVRVAFWGIKVYAE